jgi:hypothetical protein
MIEPLCDLCDLLCRSGSVLHSSGCAIPTKKIHRGPQSSPAMHFSRERVRRKILLLFFLARLLRRNGGIRKMIGIASEERDVCDCAESLRTRKKGLKACLPKMQIGC